MNKVKLKKNKLVLKNIFIIIIILIFIITSIFLNTIGNKATKNMIIISRNLINSISTNTVNNNIKIDILDKYSMNDLITVNYKNNKINSIDYNLENAYKILIEIKKAIINNINNNMENIYNYKYFINNNTIILEMPFYSYTNNLLIANLGPKISAQLSMIRTIDGSIKTNVKTYGINSLLIELYLNISITSSIVVPNTKEQESTNSYDILISSKVIQGEIPSIYNGLYEQISEKITM